MNADHQNLQSWLHPYLDRVEIQDILASVTAYFYTSLDFRSEGQREYQKSAPIKIPLKINLYKYNCSNLYSIVAYELPSKLEILYFVGKFWALIIPYQLKSSYFGRNISLSPNPFIIFV